MKNLSLLKLLLISIFFLGMGFIVNGQEKTYTLVTSASDLVAGQKYLVVGTINSEYYAMGYQKSGNRHAVTVTNDGGTIYANPATASSNQSSAYEILLGGSDGAWTFKDELNNTFLRPNATATSNGLVGEATATSTWTIALTSAGEATVLYSEANHQRNNLRFNNNVQNGTPAPLFSCYSPTNTSTDILKVYFYKAAAVSTEPRISIIYPANATTVMSADFELRFSVANFNIGGNDGKIKYILDNGTANYLTSTANVPVSGLNDGSYTISLELVNNDNSSLSTQVIATTTFTVNTSGPETVAIKEIKNGSTSYVDQQVWIKGVVTAMFNGTTYGSGYYVQDSGEPWSGIYIHDMNNTPSVGDSVLINGTVVEFNSILEISNILTFNIFDIGGTVAAPIVVTTASVQDSQYDACLVKVVNAECKSDGIQAYGNWIVNDGSGDLICNRIDGNDGFTPVLGTYYNIIGVVDGMRGEYKLKYRNANDISIYTGINPEYANKIKVYPNPATDVINIDIPDGADNIYILNSIGQVVLEINSADNTEKINIENFDAGVYFVKINKGFDNAVMKFVVK